MFLLSYNDNLFFHNLVIKKTQLQMVPSLRTDVPIPACVCAQTNGTWWLYATKYIQEQPVPGVQIVERGGQMMGSELNCVSPQFFSS